MIHLDIRTKVAILLVVGIGTYLSQSLWFEAAAMVCIGVLQLSFGRKYFSKVLFLLYVVFLLLQLLLLPLLPEMLATILSIPIVLFRKSFPTLLVLVLIVKTTKVSELIATMDKMRTPKAATVTIAVTIRYFPAIVEEWGYIRDAMRLRPVTSKRHNPFKRIAAYTECCLVPLLISASKTADELAAAAITRGIEAPGQRTCRGYHSLEATDFVMFGVCAVFLALAVAVKVVG